MNQNNINHLVIVGGGSSGWMTAAMLSKLFNTQLNITLVESDAIGTIGVGEATIPPLQLFNNVLGINEAEFIQATQATYKLGIEFEHWNKPNDSYMHAFGSIGRDIGLTPFHHFWLKSQPQNAKSFWDFSLNHQAAKQNKFQILQQIQGTPLAGLTHAYHFDAGLYANLLRQHSEQRGVTRIEGKVTSTQLDNNGMISHLILDNGQQINGDFFIDCSGFSGLLIEQALGVGFENWQHWLPCDRAYAVPCERTEPLLPYTRSIAHNCGWQWRIPLQHRTGNGLVYSSKHISDDAAKKLLLDNLDGVPLAEPKKIKFTTGRRIKQWHKNCVAIGLSSGFLEPLESTSLHLVQSAIIRLTKLFPRLQHLDQQINEPRINEFNRQSQLEFEQIRDFIILHYHLNHRDAPLWQQCQNMDIPDSLRHKIELFRSTGCVFRHQEELFSEAAWIQVMLGQGIIPQDFHPMTNAVSDKDLSEYLQNLRTIITKTVSNMPSHSNFIAR